MLLYIWVVFLGATAATFMYTLDLLVFFELFECEFELIGDFLGAIAAVFVCKLDL